MAFFPQLIIISKDPFDINICNKVIFNLLKSSSSKTTPGPDGVPPILLKNLAFELTEPLTTLFSVSLTTGIFPSIWKLAHVIPTYKKKGSKSDCSNYRC